MQTVQCGIIGGIGFKICAEYQPRLLKTKERVKVIRTKEREPTALNDHLDKLVQCAINFMSSKHGSKTILKDDLVQKL